VLLYRPDRSVAWQEFPTYTRSIGNPNDRTGSLNATNLLKGEYTLALKGQHLGLTTPAASIPVTIYPNPTDGLLTVTTTGNTALQKFVVTDAQGRIVNAHWNGNQVDTHAWAKGIYQITGYDHDRELFRSSVVVK